MEMNNFRKEDLDKLWKPIAESHKGENGRVLVIGGSKLFHTSIYWSADVAARVVDLVHFTSPANENNQAVRTRIKEGFWSGIVVDWSEVESYIEEDDAILIGPGMVRSGEPRLSINVQIPSDQVEIGLEEAGKNDDTEKIVNGLLDKYPEKRWVVDGGALQMVDPELLNKNMIVTPHLKEWRRLVEKIPNSRFQLPNEFQTSDEKVQGAAKMLGEFSATHKGVSVLLKNVDGRDVIANSEGSYVVSGGNEGLTKGGTGDVLAGLAAAFYAKNAALLAAAAASYVIKKTADELAKTVGIFYSAGDIVIKAPEVLAKKY